MTWWLEIARIEERRYTHDVHRAAYSLAPDDRRSEMHLRIGRLLLAPPAEKMA